MFLSVQYVIIMIMLFAVFLKYGVSEFSRVLLSAVFVDLYGVVDRSLDLQGVLEFCSLFSKLNISPYKGGKRNLRTCAKSVYLKPLSLLQYVLCDTTNQLRSNSIWSPRRKDQLAT